MSPKITGMIDAAQKLFARYGIRRVSVDEICREAGVSKMTFYRHFQNKSALARHIVLGIFNEEKERIRALTATDISFQEKIENILIAKMEFGERYGWEFIREMMEGPDPELRKHIVDESAKSHNVGDLLETARKRGEIRTDIKPELITYMFNLLRNALRDENLGKLYPDYATLMKEIFGIFFYGVLNREKID